MKRISVGLVGAGNMGEAIIRGLITSKHFTVYVVEKRVKRLNFLVKRYAIRKVSLENMVKACSIIIICVKPQDIDRLMSRLNRLITSRHLIISIAAGVTTTHIEKYFKKPIAVIRVMPNMPSLIAKGVSAFCLGRFANRHSAKMTHAILRRIGLVRHVREKYMDAITAISGSGPGFISYFSQAFINAACRIGLQKDLAESLFLNTLLGTAYLLTKTKLKPEKLVRKIASKGGTTEAGLKVLSRKKQEQIILEAVCAAKQRAKQLSRR